MLIHDFFDQTDKNVNSVKAAHSVSAPRSPARMTAEALWCAVWHAATALTALACWSVFAERVRRERSALALLDDAQLHDIGLSRAAADAEVARHWTDLPSRR